MNAQSFLENQDIMIQINGFVSSVVRHNSFVAEGHAPLATVIVDVPKEALRFRNTDRWDTESCGHDGCSDLTGRHF